MRLSNTSKKHLEHYEEVQCGAKEDIGRKWMGLALWASTPQNGETHSNNSSAFVGLALKELKSGGLLVISIVPAFILP